MSEASKEMVTFLYLFILFCVYSVFIFIFYVIVFLFIIQSPQTLGKVSILPLAIGK